MIKVSVIVPVYNVEKYIERCLISIMRQTVVDLIELILIDDCSNDKSMSLANSFLLNQSVLEYKIICHSKNRGVSAARNTGIDVASGKYIFFLDSDDEITHDCIEKLLNASYRRNYDVIMGNFTTIGAEIQCKLWLDKGEIIGNDLILAEFITNKWYAMVWNKMYQTQFLKENKLRFQEGIVHEDELWSFKIALFAKSMYVESAITYKYHINSNSIMTAMISKRHFICWATILLEMVNCAKVIDKYEQCKVYNYIELLKTNYTCEAFRFLNKNDFKEYYYILAKERWNPFKAFIKGNLSYKRALKDICFYLPDIMGFYYLCIWYKLTLKDL